MTIENFMNACVSKMQGKKVYYCTCKWVSSSGFGDPFTNGSYVRRVKDISKINFKDILYDEENYYNPKLLSEDDEELKEYEIPE